MTYSFPLELLSAASAHIKAAVQPHFPDDSVVVSGLTELRDGSWIIGYDLKAALEGDPSKHLAGNAPFRAEPDSGGFFITAIEGPQTDELPMISFELDANGEVVQSTVGNPFIARLVDTASQFFETSGREDFSVRHLHQVTDDVWLATSVSGASVPLVIDSFTIRAEPSLDYANQPTMRTIEIDNMGRAHEIVL